MMLMSRHNKLKLKYCICSLLENRVLFLRLGLESDGGFCSGV